MKKLILFIFSLMFAIVLAAQDIDSLVKEGEANYTRKNYKTAYDKFKAAMKVNPNHHEAARWYWKMKKEHDIANLTDSNISLPEPDKPVVQKPQDTAAPAGKWVQPLTADKPGSPKNIETQRRGYPAAESERLKMNELDRKLTKIQNLVSDLNVAQKNPDKQVDKNDQKKTKIADIINLYYLLPLGLMSLLTLFFIILIIMLRKKRKKFGDFQPASPPAYNDQYLLDMDGNRIQGARPFGHRDPMLLPSPQPRQNNLMITQVGQGDFSGELLSSDPDFYKFESFANGYVYLLEKKYKRGDNTRKIKSIANEIGIQLGMSREDILELRIVAILRDIGFLMIPESIILKNGALTKNESLEVFRHPMYSSEMMKSMNMPERVVQSVIYHHERYDGSGYPNGIAGPDIPLFARIVGLCESYVSLTSEKPYKPAVTTEQAVGILNNEKHLFDPEILKILFAIVNETV